MRSVVPSLEQHPAGSSAVAAVVNDVGFATGAGGSTARVSIGPDLSQPVTIPNTVARQPINAVARTGNGTSSRDERRIRAILTVRVVRASPRPSRVPWAPGRASTGPG